MAGDENSPATVVNRQLPPEASQFGQLGYVPYVPKNFLELIYQESVPRADQLGQKVSLQATPGEFETGALGIYAPEDLHAVKVEAGDLKATAGRAVISAANIDVRSAFYMKRRCWALPKYRVLPVILEKREALDIGEGQSQLYYLTVHVPTGTPAGTYLSRVRITAEGRAATTIDLELEVLPFTLSDPGILYAFWYHDGNKSSGMTFLDLAAMRGCGMTSVMPVYGAGVKVETQGEEATFDFAELIDFAEQYRRLGYYQPMIYNLVLKHLMDLTDEQFADFLHQMNAMAEARGWPGFIWNIGDENDANPERLAQAQAFLARIDKVVPQDLTKNTLVFPENSEVYGSDLDIRVWSGYFDGTVIEKGRQAGATLGIYNGTGTYELIPRDNRFFYGLWAWRSGAKHLEQWVFNTTMYKPDQPFNDLAEPGAVRGNCYFYCYPGPGGPLPTVGYYGIMEGIDDARYLHTLAQAIERAKASDSAAAKDLAGKAEEFLGQWRSRIDLSPLPNRNVLPNFTIRREVERVALTEYDDLRRNVADFIVRLNQLAE